MTSRNRVGLKARLGIATAVLVGGGAIGVAAVAASGHGTTTGTQSAGYTTNFRHTVPLGSALSSALSSLQAGHQGKVLTTLASMAPAQNFAQVHRHHTTLAVQRGVVELASKHFLLVKSANGALHLWWLAGTKTVNASSNTTALTALTGSNSAASAATSGNMTQATVTMAGSTGAASTMAAPAAKPTTVTVSSGNSTITITITSSSAMVSAPATTPATTTSTAATSAAGAAASGPTVMAKQPAFTQSKGVARGDLALVTGIREHGFLIAKLVAFAPPTKATTTPTTVTPTASTAFSGTHA